MVATVNIVEYNGASTGVATVITTGRYCTRDSYNPGDNDPCVVPTAGSNYSYWKTHGLQVTGTSYTTISNIRIYGSGTIASDWDLNSGKVVIGNKTGGGDSGLPIANYYQATGTAGETGHDMNDVTNGHTYYKTGTSNYSAAADLDNYTSAAPLVLDSTAYTSAGNPSGFVSKLAVTQVVIATDSVQGDKSNTTITIRYDEI